MESITQGQGTAQGQHGAHEAGAETLVSPQHQKGMYLQLFICNSDVFTTQIGTKTTQNIHKEQEMVHRVQTDVRNHQACSTSYQLRKYKSNHIHHEYTHLRTDKSKVIAGLGASVHDQAQLSMCKNTENNSHTNNNKTKQQSATEKLLFSL